MISRIFHAVLASSVVAGTAAAASYGVTHWVPQGHTREAIERCVTAPGHALYVRLKEDKAAQQSIEKAGADLKKLENSIAGQELAKGASKAQKLMHLYNVGTWAGVGFIVCLVLTVIFGIESIGAALALGFKVTLALIFLQGALILGGVLVLQKLAS